MRFKRENERPIMPRPDLSIIIPTYNRIDALEQLLQSLSNQSVSAHCFEVIVVDDGSARPVELQANKYPFQLVSLRQENAGPAAARNHGISHAKAPLTLILNDDAIADPKLIEVHLKTHAERTDKVAVLGQFPFALHLLDSPFMQVLDASDLLFPHRYLTAGELHGPGFFWTCNISLPTQALRDVDGFDDRNFRQAICEDVEIGFRLAAIGYQVLYNPEAICIHDHYISPLAYVKRARKLGVNMAKLARIHGWDQLNFGKPIEEFDEYLAKRRREYEALLPKADSILVAIERVEASRKIGTLEQLNTFMDAVWWVNWTHYLGGMLEELEDGAAFIDETQGLLRIA